MFLLILMCGSHCASVFADERPADAFETIWGLRPGDSFVVDVLIHRQTIIRPTQSAGEGLEAVDTSSANLEGDSVSVSDRWRLEYRVQSVSPSGRLHISVRVAEAERNTDPQGPHSTGPLSNRKLQTLQGLELLFAVNSEGEVEGVDEGDRTAMVSTFTGLNPDVEACLQECCSSQNIIGWFAKPFWFNVSNELPGDEPSLDVDVTSSPSRDVRDEISLGVLGRLRTNVRLLQQSTASLDKRSNRINYTITGNGRFVPVQVTQMQPVRFVAVSAQLDSYSGTASVIPTVASESQVDRTRPLFDRLDLSYVMRGSCEMEVAQRRKKLEFQQTQVQTWTLRSSQMRRSFLDQSDRLMLPVDPVP